MGSGESWTLPAVGQWLAPGPSLIFCSLPGAATQVPGHRPWNWLFLEAFGTVLILLIQFANPHFVGLLPGIPLTLSCTPGTGWVSSVLGQAQDCCVALTLVTSPVSILALGHCPRPDRPEDMGHPKHLHFLLYLASSLHGLGNTTGWPPVTHLLWVVPPSGVRRYVGAHTPGTWESLSPLGRLWFLTYVDRTDGP